MRSLDVLLVAAPPKQPWFWLAADVVVGVLLLANVLLIVGVHLREMRQRRRERRATKFVARAERIRAALRSGETDATAIRGELGQLDELEWPLVAAMLVESLPDVSAEERAHTLVVMRELGAVERLLRWSRRASPWRRAQAAMTLGALGADEAVPVLLACLSDRSRHVREAAVRALGRIADVRALPALAGLYAEPRSVAPGLVYDALLAFGSESQQVFSVGLGSSDEHVRVASVFGLAAVGEAPGPSLQRMLADDAAPVRAAAAEMLGRLGGEKVPEELGRASRDEHRNVRRAAVSALAGYDDAEALRLALSALDDPDRDTAVRAGQTLVRLSKLPSVGAEAAGAVTANDSWPIATARVVSSLGA